METAWVKFTRPYIFYNQGYEEGEVIPVNDMEDLDFLVTNGIAEIEDIEVQHYIHEDEEFMRYGVEKEQIVTYSDYELNKDILLKTIYPEWKRR
ncbi:hypothetical protein AB1283_00960 [Bacillus sp. S13(2024)]|uniref:hypothetical protein n=1 Tax=Bacillus sp. S13(2024) TaxID=3162885 RepID=UPI003D2539CD